MEQKEINFNEEIENEVEEKELKSIDDAENLNSSNSLNRLDVNYYIVERTISNLLKWIEKDKLIIPDFQRDYVWDFEKASLLIDSVLTNLPIPNIFVYRDIINGKEKLTLIDGKQRLTTFLYFYKGEYELNGKKKIFKLINNEYATWNEKTYNELTQDDKDAFDEYNIKMTVFENSKDINDSDKKKAMLQIFKRVNSGAEELEPQEIRNAVYNSEQLSSIKKYADDVNSNYYLLIKKDLKQFVRYKSHETLLRIMTYYDIYKKKKNGVQITEKSKYNAINDYLGEITENQKKYDEDFNVIKKALEVLYNWNDICLYNVKRNYNGIGNKIHEVFSEALVIALIENNFDIKIDKESFNCKKIDIWKDTIKKSYFVSNTISIDNIFNRVNLLKDILNVK